ncbi:unnamed protein product [Paramecium sonneborni]|uniref:Uncharacterized protein n=1 Tax=Paramecium sonneborni TaxID=65129 RepID=A0A8S1QE31_9CILI|nr:unnamed protein product [Paramecium sonneborni]
MREFFIINESQCQNQNYVNAELYCKLKNKIKSFLNEHLMIHLYIKRFMSIRNRILDKESILIADFQIWEKLKASNSNDHTQNNIHTFVIMIFDKREMYIKKGV